MNAVPFDTLKFARALREKAKLSPEQAEGFAEAIQGVKTALQTEVRVVMADVREAGLRLEAKIEASNAEVVKWMFGTIGFQTLIILGAVIALTRIVRP